MQRREFIKVSSLAVAASAASGYMTRAATAKIEKPNVILLVVDQMSYGLTRANGYPLDTCPTLDGLQKRGVGFKHNYCTMPLCVPSRISMLTGRWPDAHRVRMNLQASDAFFEKDIYQVAKSRGYRTALVGKNHTYLKRTDVDVWREYFHDGGPPDGNVQPSEAAYDHWLREQHFNVVNEATPFPVDVQLPYRIVRDAMQFIEETAGQPFFLQVSIPEPHDPEQVPPPYWNMFPPESIPARCAGPENLPQAGFRAQWEYRMQQDASPQTELLWRRYLSNYMGCLRMIDDQVKRLVEHLESSGLLEKTVFVFTTDHGDSLMKYGIAHKGLGLQETVTHTSQIWFGYGVKPGTAALDEAFTSMADLMPTLCECMGAEIPRGVQGRSLLPLLRGESYPVEEFRSIATSLGVGGLYYKAADHVPLSAGQDPHGASFDELNKVTLSGTQKMVRMGEWKLVYDMMGYGQMFHLKADPCELKNLFNHPGYEKQQAALMAELMMWSLRIQDSLPTGPQNRKYETKWSTKHNWYEPYRETGPPPVAFVP